MGVSQDPRLVIKSSDIPCTSCSSQTPYCWRKRTEHGQTLTTKPCSWRTWADHCFTHIPPWESYMEHRYTIPPNSFAEQEIPMHGGKVCVWDMLGMASWPDRVLKGSIWSGLPLTNPSTSHLPFPHRACTHRDSHILKYGLVSHSLVLNSSMASHWS